MVWLRQHPIIRAVLGTIAALFVTLILVGGALLVVMKGRDLQVPRPVQERLIQQLNASISGVTLSFDDVTIGLSENWQPTLNLQRVALSQGDKPSFLQLNTVQAQVSLDDALRGSLRVSEVSMEGANVAIQRDLGGQVTLKFGDLAQPTNTSLDLYAVLAAIDQAAADQSLSQFRQFELVGLTVQYDDLISQQSYIVDGARLRVARQDETLVIRADMALLNGGAGVSTLEVNYKSPIGNRAAEFGILLTDMPAQSLADQSKILAWLGPLDATISGALRGGLTETGVLMPINGTLQISQGQLRPNDNVRAIPFDGARTYFTFDPVNNEITFSGISVNSRDVTLSSTGYSVLENGADGKIQFTGQLQVTKLEANPFALLPSPIVTNQARVDFRLGLDPFTVDLSQIYIEDQISKSHVIASADLRADTTGWNIGLSANIPSVDLETILRFWPETFKEAPRTWVSTNLHKGQLRDVTFSMRAQNQQKPEVSVSYWFEETDFHFMPDMPVVSGASGLFTSHDFRTSIEMTKGGIVGDSGKVIDLAGTRFVIPDSRIKPSPAFAELKAKGDISDILSAFNNKPFLVLDKMNRSADFVSGYADAQARVDLVLKKGLKPTEAPYTVSATLRNVVSKTVIPNRILSSRQLDMTIDKDVLTLSGQARLDGVAGQGTFTAYLGPTYSNKPATVRVKAKVGSGDLATLGVKLPEGLIDGTTDVAFDATFEKNKAPRYRAKSNLVGATISLPQVTWSKPSSGPASFEVAGQFDGKNILEKFYFTADGLTAVGSGRFDGGKFQVLSLEDVKLGSTFSGGVDIASTGKITIKGGRADLSKITKRIGNATAGAQGGTTLSVQLGRLDVTDKIFLSDFVMDFGKNGSGTFSALVNNGGRITGILGRNQGRTTIKIKANNAGKTLVSAGFLKRASGGTLVLDLETTGRSGEIDGTLAVKDIRIQNAPILVELLNAVSVVGLLDQLTGSGLAVNEINAAFRSTPKQIIVESASMFGPSLGMTVDGYYAKADQSLDFQGVLSPLYVLNGIGSIFSKKGEGLIGFNFNIGGNADNPRVSLNPLSIFTPAMFREIFRRPPPKLE